MFIMNDNDLNLLFRRASEKYPLRIKTAEWEEVARELDEQGKYSPIRLWPEYMNGRLNKIRFNNHPSKKCN